MSEPVPLEVDADDPSGNNTVAAGAVYAALAMARPAAARVTRIGGPEMAANQLLVEFDFLDSPYRITVERVTNRGKGEL